MCKIRAIDSMHWLAVWLFHQFENNERWIGLCVRGSNFMKPDRKPMFDCRVNDTLFEIRPIIKTSVMLPIVLRSDDICSLLFWYAVFGPVAGIRKNLIPVCDVDRNDGGHTARP